MHVLEDQHEADTVLAVVIFTSFSCIDLELEMGNLKLSLEVDRVDPLTVAHIVS